MYNYFKIENIKRNIKIDTNLIIFFIAVLWFVSLITLFIATKIYYLDLFPFFDTNIGFSDSTSWLPMASDVSRGNFFPLTSAIDKNESGLSYLPYITIWVYGLLIFILDVNGAFIFGTIIFPTLSFIFMIKIYNFYLPLLWSVSLSSLGIITLSYLPFRDFLMSSLTGEGWKTVINGNPLDIISVPFPSFSLMMFLIALLLTINIRKKISFYNITLLTILWTIQFYIYTVNGILGLPFWYLILFLKLWRNKISSKKKYSILLFQLLVSFVICIPLLIGFINNFSTEIASNSGILNYSKQEYNSIGSYFFIIYFIIPITLLTIIYFIQRIDFYEIIQKFFPIFFLMLVELSLVLLKTNTGYGIPTALIFDRIGTFFLHLFYFVPVIFYLRRPLISYSIGVEANFWAKKTRKILHWLFVDFSFLYLPLILFLLTWKTYSSYLIYSERMKENFSNNIIDNKIISSIKNDLKVGDGLVSYRIRQNIMLPIIGPYQTLLVSKFTNKVSTDLILERLVLWAKLVGLTREEFISFMTFDEKFSFRSKKRFNLNDFQNLSGIGYWLLFSRGEITSMEKNDLYLKLKYKFDNIDVLKSVKKYNIKQIITSRSVPKGLDIVEKTSIQNFVIYKLK